MQDCRAGVDKSHLLVYIYGKQRIFGRRQNSHAVSSFPSSQSERPDHVSDVFLKFYLFIAYG